MGCFCHGSLAPLSAMLPKLDVSVQAGMPGADVALGVSAWLSARGLPALPWQPDPSWLSLALPQLRLSASAVATISAAASLRAQVLAQFGIDLLVPGQARAFARIVATLNARLQVLARIGVNPAGWLGLATLNGAVDQVQVALQAGLLAPSASLMAQLTLPGGIPVAQWVGFLAQLQALAPMVAAMAQLGVSVSETAQLAAALRVMARLSLPALQLPQLAASLTAALSAVAQLQASLGVSPLQLGFPAVQLRVQAKLALLLPALQARLGLNLGAGGGAGGDLLAALLALLPQVPVVPTSFAVSAVVQAAVQAQAVAALDWQVPASLPAVGIGLPVCALAAQVSAAFGVNAVLPSPCGSGCDAARAMAALEGAVPA
jgi:hypothetical protein